MERKKGLKRNDTSFAEKSTAMLRTLYQKYIALRAGGPTTDETLWAGALKYYQYLVRAVMTDPEYGIGAAGNARGLLVWHHMGLGKSRLAVAVAMSLWDVRPPVIMLARGLQKNFRSTVDDVVRLLHPDLAPDALAAAQSAAAVKFTYVSMDAYNSADQMARVGTGATRVRRGDMTGATGGLDGKLLIVDEAHNFFRAIINSGAENANARRMYEMIMTARNLRILFLTGTPCSKNPFEIVPCFNMLAGTDLLPTQYETFQDLYVDKVNRTVRNRERLANRLMGLVSHASHSRPTEPPGGGAPTAAALGPKKAGDIGWFPVALPTIIERVEMGVDQYRTYLLAREKEEAEGKREGSAYKERRTPPLALPGSEKKAMSTYYVQSRSLSIFAPPSKYASTPVDLMPDDVFVEAHGPKLFRAARRALDAPGPILIYSQFVEYAGLKPLGRYLQRLGFRRFEPVLEKKPPRRSKVVPPSASEEAPTLDEIADTLIDSEDTTDEVIGGGESGVLNLRELNRLASELPIVQMRVRALVARLKKPAHWDQLLHDITDSAPPKSPHYERQMTAVRSANLDDPILISSDNELLDGTDRLVRAFFEHRTFIPVRTVPAAMIVDASHTVHHGGTEPTNAAGLNYVIISGEVEHAMRDAIKVAFNDPANLRGGRIKAILVSKTGAEGLDLKYLRETLVVECYWDRARDMQVAARAVRLGAHDLLPQEDRVVQSEIYIATANKKVQSDMLPEDREKKTIDEQFYDKATEQYEINQAFRDLLAEVCYECELLNYGKCRVCVPTDTPLFHDDPALDIRLPDPCIARQESEIAATPIDLNGITYYYIVDPTSPFGYTFYAHRSDLGGYATLEPSNPIVMALVDKISQPS